MQEIIKKSSPFIRKAMSKADAAMFFKEKGEDYKPTH